MSTPGEVWGVWISGGPIPEQWMFDPTKWTQETGNIRFEGTEAEATKEAADANARCTCVREKGRPLYTAKRIP